MSTMPRVSLAETENFLKEKCNNKVSLVQSLGEGAWSYAFTFLLHDGKYVIRWANVPDNFERDAFAHTYDSVDLPVPPIIEMGDANERYYAISPFAVGNFLDTLAPHDLEIATPSVISMFRALRGIDVSTTTGYGYWNKEGISQHESWKSFLLDDGDASENSLIQGWKETLNASEMGMSVYEKLWMKFVNLIEYCPEDRYVVHSDLLNRNVLVDKEKVSAVLDWGSAFYGDSLYDIAWIKYCEPWFPASKHTKIVEQLIQDFLIDPNSNTTNFEKRLLCYQLHIAANAIARNAFRNDWKTARFIEEYSERLFA